MDDTWTRVLTDLLGRLHGPLTFRFILQPVMAMVYATRDGVKDARAHRPPYFWTIFTHREERGALLRDGWKAVARVIGLGVVMDAAYQLLVFKWIYPFEVVVIVFVLAFLPYLLLRGLVNRIVAHWGERKVAAR